MCTGRLDNYGRRPETCFLYQLIKLATYGQRSFSHAAPMLWNSLPDSLRHCATLSSFKLNIKTYLFKQAYDI